MQKFKDRWEIKSNWQLIFPLLGVLSLLISSYLVSTRILQAMDISQTDSAYIGLLSAFTIFLSALLLFITLKLFTVLESRWEVTYRWELIAIFIAFAVTGSTAAKISDPIISFLGIHKETVSGWLYWPVRILFVFPIYQVLLLIVGWLFGQFKFFWKFEKKMLSRMGLSRLFVD